MEFILLLLIVIGAYALHWDHKILAEGIDETNDKLDKILKHLGIEEEKK